MRVAKVVVVALLLVVVVAVVGSIGVLTGITMRSQAQTSGTIEVDGLSEPATVQRDAHGIAHITAATPADLFFAQGYVHAQERMWQMEVWRHISSGRLSELFGEGTLDTDRFIRTLGWRRAAERDLVAVAPDTRLILDSYADGVNAWLDDNRDRLGLAYLVSGADPEPWTALDSVAWGKVQAWNLGGNMETEIFRHLADARLGGAERTDELFPTPYQGPVITPSGLPGSGGAGAGGAAAGAAAAPEGVAAVGPARDVPAARDAGDTGGTVDASLTPRASAAWVDLTRAAGDAMRMAGLSAGGGLGQDDGIGSNDWVVGPGRSATGGALLANDPHLGISMPSIWFMNGLHCRQVSEACPFDVAGVSFPGVPAVVLGHNARIAWGATNVDPDVQDLVVETVDPADPTRYLGPDGRPTPFETRTEEIRVAGGETVRLEVRETAHGPILNGVDERLSEAPLMALRWTAIHPAFAPDRTLEAVLGLNTATDFAGFRESLSRYGAPSQNFVYADVDGHIGYQLPGVVPIRSDPSDLGGRPVAGNDGLGEWTGRIAVEDLPWQYDPEPEAIVTANNAPVDEDYPYLIGVDFDPGFRAERVIDLIARYAQDGLTVDEMGEIQNDTAPLRARDVVIDLADVEPGTDDGAAVAAALSDWDGTCTTDSLGCAAHAVWEYHALRALLDDELGDLARMYVGTSISWTFLAEQLEDPDSRWWDDQGTPDVVETAGTVVAGAMDAAGAELREALGGPDGWTWGRVHTATFAEATIGTSGIGPLEWYFNEGPVAASGTSGAVNAANYDLSRAYPDPLEPDEVPLGIDGRYTVTSLPSYRILMDLSDLDGARIIITTGQSGNPFDDHYSDLIEPWRTGETIPLPFSRAAIDAATTSTLTLAPPS